MTNDEPRPTGTALVPVPQDELDHDEELLHRIEQLPREVAWLMVYVGVLGLVVPGILGAPFLVAGTAILSPGGPKRLARWAGRKPHRLVHLGVAQITRLVDDLERRYPLLPKPGG